MEREAEMAVVRAAFDVVHVHGSVREGEALHAVHVHGRAAPCTHRRRDSEVRAAAEVGLDSFGVRWVGLAGDDDDAVRWPRGDADALPLSSRRLFRLDWHERERRETDDTVSSRE